MEFGMVAYGLKGAGRRNCRGSTADEFSDHIRRRLALNEFLSRTGKLGQINVSGAVRVPRGSGKRRMNQRTNI
jgi:hypothetical protein